MKFKNYGKANLALRKAFVVCPVNDALFSLVYTAGLP
jgi:hypothetical protein